jgi:hypothetical protein
MTRRLLTVLVFVAGAAPTFVLAQDFESNRETLVGLSGFEVGVQGFDEEDADARLISLTRSQLQTDTELRLRKAGIPITEGRPYLLVSVDFTGCEEECGFSVAVQVNQLVLLDRDLSVRIVAPTWGKSFVGVVSRSLARGAIRGAVGDCVDEFLNAYLSVNPKP